MYPVWEVDGGLVTFRNCELRLLLWFSGDSGCRNITRNGNTRPPEIICNAADMKVNVVHLAKLLCCLFVVAPRLRIELNPVMTIFALNTFSHSQKNGGVWI